MSQAEVPATVPERVEALSTDLFASIPSQTSERDRRSLLAVQRSTARRFGRFAYLEIGSHLGGSIQPYLLDPRCEAIYSIDPRPASQPDDRSPGCRVGYEGNSTQRMLDRLRELAPDRLDRVRCFEADASRVDPSAIELRPHVAFIDGEHTRRAVVSDFRFCRSVLAPGGTIVFDDFPIVYPGVLDVLGSLRRTGEGFATARLEGKAFAVFFDRDVVEGDPFLRRCRARNRFSLLRYRVKRAFRDALAAPGRDQA